jgi:hypothetical protein
VDNEVCLAWLVDALQQPRQEGRTKATGYLKAVLEEVVFEAKMAPKYGYIQYFVKTACGEVR